MAELRARIETDALLTAAVLFVGANLLHTADHFRQGTSRLTTEVLAGGTFLTLAAFAVLWLASTGDPRTAVAATWIGFTGAIGVTAAHLLPHWSALSDSYPDIGVDAASWTIVLLEIAAAAWLGMTGLRALKS